ncbi:hypothetical protein DKX38_026361 [Salix brachista]|uniref:SPARK domain-containing protein n=1 Tax=Salix brachista TaxID=2182728 RepID=A0A5N5JEM3_9ROSI|nr:hypothetical protein DKX38_026361 [Salix brachista]
MGTMIKMQREARGREARGEREGDAETERREAACVRKFKGFPFPKFNGAGRLVKYGGFPDFQLSKGFQVAVALQTPLEPDHVSSTSELGTPPISGLFGPIEISPSVLPCYPYPGENLAPMYPTFPTTYEPNLTGKCPVNFTAMSNVIDRTASDCSQPLAALVGNVICCPQLGSLLHIFQGYFSGNSDKLVLQNAVADDCFSDIISILASRGANITIPTLCSVKSLNLTGGLCPVKDVVNFEKIVNTSKLLEACSTVDPLKECCRPICQSAIMEAALEISGTQLTINDYKDWVTVPNHNDPLSDCKGVVFSYISRKLSADAASSACRIVSACKVNKEHLAHKRRMRMIKRKIMAQTMFVDERGHEAGSDQKLHFHENDG